MPADFSRHAKTLVEQYGLAERHLPDARARDLALCRVCPPSDIDLVGLSGPAARRRPGGRDGRSASPARDRGGRPPAAAREMPKRPPRSPRRCISRFARTRAAGQGEETLFNRRSGLAEVVIPPRSGLDRADRVSGHGHRERRPHRSRRAAGRSRDRCRQPKSGRRRHRVAGRRHHAAPGNLEGSRSSSQRSGRAGRELARAGATPGRAHGTGRISGDRHPDRHGRSARDRPRAAGRGRSSRRRRHRPVADHDRRAILSRHRLDDGDPRRRHDAAVDSHGGDRGRQADGRRPRLRSSAMPDPMPCSPASSCSPRSWAS